MLTNRKIAEFFSEEMFDLIILSGGLRSTAYKCMATWWEAIERGEFGLE